MQRPPIDADMILECPTGCAFISVMTERQNSVEEIAEHQRLAFEILTLACSETETWWPLHERTVASLLAQRDRWTPYAEELVSHPKLAWWFGPLERDAQVTLQTYPAFTWSVRVPEIPAGGPTEREIEFARPDWAQFTETLKDGTTSYDVSAELNFANIAPVPFPGRRERVPVPPDARVYEVTDPQSWHELSVQYGVLNPLGEYVPDFARVADDWDGVHISVAAILTANLVPYERHGKRTCLRNLQSEETSWLHPVWLHAEG